MLSARPKSASIQLRSLDALAFQLAGLVLGLEGAVEEGVGVHPGGEAVEVFGGEGDIVVAHGLYFNNTETLRRKTRYALEEGLAGVMIWELSMDTRDETSLLKAVTDEIAHHGRK